ncbi:cysteine desulfurase family protein [Rubellicoccus peritrichatus]|uniref:Cysteine desulfurase family protein n=1 Tax=Rubellicoccus peritrichatus TaxID=3080537 RepID=A0AAQ3QUD4_9BACT|nr:cysteine desulfurase family protein [Puniceicoccus sp. CR14]WOO39572.1 cysteine desulfurase family protein [Puniceicoccus sp. CR14]
MLYFDVNATAPPLPEVESVYAEANRSHWHNPSSPYSRGARVHILIDTLRQEIGHLIGCSPELIVFNSGATEGNNAVLAETARKFPNQRIVVSAIEHPCVIEPAKRYFPERHQVAKVDSSGRLDLNHLEAELSKGGVCLVSVMAANNETGVIQPWKEALDICRKYKVLFHCDAAQHLGKKPANGLGDCDFVTGCGHKFGAPKGSGFIKIPESFEDFKGTHGGGQENGHRSGTEDYPSLAAMVAALKFREHSMDAVNAAWAVNKSVFEKSLLDKIPDAVIIGQNTNRLANTSCILMPGFPGARWVARLDKHGVSLSTGSACASGKTGASHVLTAMGIEAEDARRSIRISACWDATPEDWSALTKTLFKAYDELINEKPASPGVEVIQI